MKKTISFALAPVAFLMLFPACATPRAQFVLLREADGSSGTIIVRNEVGTAEVSQPGGTVRVASAQKAPREGKSLDDAEIQSRYGETLSRLPEPPVAFNIYFAPGSAELAEGSVQELQRVLDAVRQRGSHDLSLNGHTDTLGGPEDNMELSLRRADTVRGQLVQAGIPQDFFSTEYYGESHLAIPTADEVDEPRNRRVEVVVR